MLVGKRVSIYRDHILCPYIVSTPNIASREIRVKPFIVSNDERRRTIVCERGWVLAKTDRDKDLTFALRLFTDVVD